VKLRLKGIIMCSFQRSEATNLKIYRKSPEYPGDLQEGEVFLFVSRGLNQVIFVFRDKEGITKDGWEYDILDSRRLRLAGATWHPYMLQEYARQVGLSLIGIRSFGEILEERRQEQREQRLARKRQGR